jgi:fatty-acyl-CoA synthase
MLIDHLGERFDASPALVSPEATLTYSNLAADCNRYARWAVSEGLEHGDTVCLLMLNSVQYMPIWIGLSRVGITVALLNTQLRSEALAHCIRIVTPKLVVVGSQLCNAITEVRPRIDFAVGWWIHGADLFDLPRLDVAVCDLPSDTATEKEIPLPTLDDRALLIYTSGTTGLPKAANVSHFRLMQWSHWFAGMMDTSPSDRMYDCLPMYHSIGGVVATGATLVGGGAVVLREKFSACEFWRDIANERCTLFQYIGELCRYLVNTSPSPIEADHVLRLCCGNGLRGDIWAEFQRRFQVPQILEYYASTEGNFSLYNCEGKMGAIGRVPPFLKHRMPVEIVRFDIQSEFPSRDADGRCAACQPNEVGEALGKLPSADSTELGRFEGYADAEATDKKILRDVFARGDAWYRTGDLMRRDEQGFFYFVDRVGDTFRWKGENVSAAEVTSVITSCPGVTDAVVFGVQVPGAEGRAGMAALVVQPEFEIAALRVHLVTRLPDYARPLFIRLASALELTGTFKLRKQALQAEGFTPRSASDLYVDNRLLDEYVRLDYNVLEQLRSGSWRI